MAKSPYPQTDRELTRRIERSGGRAGYKQLIRELGLGGGRERRLLLEQLARMTARGELVKTEEIAAHALVTKPPARYTEATLLSAMEGAGKLVEDEELREAMRAKGLGTPATRAAMIEGLIHDGYVTRQGRDMIATAKAWIKAPQFRETLDQQSRSDQQHERKRHLANHE